MANFWNLFWFRVTPCHSDWNPFGPCLDSCQELPLIGSAHTHTHLLGRITDLSSGSPFALLVGREAVPGIDLVGGLRDISWELIKIITKRSSKLSNLLPCTWINVIKWIRGELRLLVWSMETHFGLYSSCYLLQVLHDCLFWLIDQLANTLLIKRLRKIVLSCNFLVAVWDVLMGTSFVTLKSEYNVPFCKWF